MTTRIQVSDSGLEVIPPRDTLTQGSENTLLLEFEFSGQWLECTEINAVFTDDINSATTPITGGACVIPVEVLQNPWRFVTLSLNGTSVSGVITSPFVRIGQVLPSAMGGEGGKFVTMAQLMEILHGYVKVEDLDIYVTQEQLQAAIETLATQDDIARLDELKADKTTVAALAGTVAAQGVELEKKADAATVTALETRVGTNETNVAALQNGKADKTQLADYWSKAEIGLQTDGDGKEFLANDGKYYPIQGGTGDEKTFIAEYNVTTAQEIIDFIDASNEPFAPMLVKRGTDYYTVTTAAKQDANKVIIRTFATLSGNYYMFTYTITGSTWASASYGFQKLLESGTNIKTINGQSLLGSGDIPIQGGGVQFQANWNETDDTSPAYIQNKPTIPDVSDLASKESVQAVSDTVSALETRVGAAETSITALQNDKADKTQLSDYETSEHAAATFAQKADIADMLTKTEAQETYADKASMLTLENTVEAQAARISQAETNISALQTDIAGKASDADLHALSARVGANETNITALQNDKADASALADYETTAHAAATYETKADASKIKSITAAGFAVTPDAAGNVNIGGTMVSRDADSGSWGSEITYQISQTLPAGATPGTNPTPGASLTIVKRTENSGATPRITMMIDGVRVATFADIPDVSQFATIDYVQNTYAKKTDIITVTDGDGKSFLANDGTYKVPSLDGVVKKVVQNLQFELQDGGYTSKWRELTPDANGTLEIQTAHASYCLTSADGYSINQFAICDCMAGQDEKPYIMNVLLKSKSTLVDSYVTIHMDTWESGSTSTLASLDVPSIYMLDNRIATATTDMATQTWVHQYIASLDGTNMQF